MAQTLEALIEREFEQVGKEREDLLVKRTEIDEQLRALERRLEAAANYRATLEGKFARPTRQASQRKRSGRAPRGARGEMRAKIIELVRQGELTAAAIYAELEATDAIAKRPIDAALTQMKKDGTLKQGRVKGPYTLAPAKREETA
jgi:hypothetical protein